MNGGKWFPVYQSDAGPELYKKPRVRWQQYEGPDPDPSELAGYRLPVGVMVIDKDPAKKSGQLSGFDAIRLFAPVDEPEHLPVTLPATFTLPSVSGRGEHAYYRVDPDRYAANKRGILENVDFRVGGKGYVAVPPELRRSVQNLDVASLPMAPDWVYALSERTATAKRSGSGNGWVELRPGQPTALEDRLNGDLGSGQGEKMNNAAYHYASETGEGWDDVGEQFVAAGMAAGSDNERETRRAVMRGLADGVAACRVVYAGSQQWADLMARTAPARLAHAHQQLANRMAGGRAFKELATMLYEETGGRDRAQAVLGGAAVVEAEAERSGYLLSASDWFAMPEPEPLITDVLPVGQSLFFGDSSAGKSFLAVDVSLRLALGLDWHGFEVPAARKVVYVAAEGEASLKARVEAWLDHEGRTADDLADRWTVVREGLVLDQAALFIEQCQEWGAELVVYDTWGRVAAGDENDNGLANQHLATIARAAPSSLLVHHMGHEHKNRPRGASALHNGLDCSYLVKGEHSADVEAEGSGRLVGVTLVNKKGRGRNQAEKVSLLVKDHREAAVLVGDGAGANSTEGKVLCWREDNPGGTQAQCSEELGLGERTVRRYWQVRHLRAVG